MGNADVYLSNIAAAVIDTIDAFTGGFLTNALLADLSEQYQVEYAELESLYNTLMSEYDAESTTASEIKAALNGNNPLGQAYKTLVSKYKQSTSTASSAYNQALETSSEMTSVANEMAKSVGTRTVETVNNAVNSLRGD